MLGFNYNASTGDYEFFSSTDGTTDTGTIAASGNFSSTQPLYLGTSENGGQFMDGMVGEVQVYNMVLSSSEFATRAEQLVGKWVSRARYDHLARHCRGALCDVSSRSPFSHDQCK